MTVQVTVTRPAGSSAGPFDIYTDADGYDTPIRTNVTFNELQVGYIIGDVPESATIIRVQSISGCTNEEETYITSIPICDSTPVIEKQMWMGCNLDVTTYSDNVTPILEIQDGNAFRLATVGAWCWYNEDSANGEIYGKLYNGEAVMGIWNEESRTNVSLRKKLAPDGWKIPSQTDFNTLINYSGGLSIAGNRLKQTGDYTWPIGNTAVNLNGFTALPGGKSDFFSQDIGVKGFFWSSTQYSGITSNNYLEVDSDNSVVITTSPWSKGFSVRCISDTEQVYPKCGDVDTGTQTWSRCNLNTTKYQNGDDIPFASNLTQWQQYSAANTGAWCYPNFSQSTGDTFKKLYNWWAVNDTTHGGLIPVGYHVPTQTEFETLATEVGGIDGAALCGPKLREQGTRYWSGENGAPLATAANNLSKFTAFPTGQMSDGGVYSGTVGAVWWTNDAGTGSNRKVCRLRNRDYATAPNALSFDLGFLPDAGAGVRLIKNSI